MTYSFRGVAGIRCLSCTAVKDTQYVRVSLFMLVLSCNLNLTKMEEHPMNDNKYVGMDVHVATTSCVVLDQNRKTF
jgi:hypothetical protein